jgi:hypothetical protein
VGGGNWENPDDSPLFLDRFNSAQQTFTHFIKEKETGSASNLTGDGQGNIWFVDQVSSLQKLNLADGSRQKFSDPIINLKRAGGGRGISLAKGNDGSLWLYGRNGLFEFDSETERFYAYGEAFGVRPLGYPNSTFHVAADGEILIAGRQGFLAFYPEKIARTKNIRPPRVGITALRLLGKPVVPGNGAGNLYPGILQNPSGKPPLSGWRTTKTYWLSRSPVLIFSTRNPSNSSSCSKATTARAGAKISGTARRPPT